MTIFITPYGRLRRRMRDHMAHEDLPYGNETDLVVPVDVRAEGDDFIITAMLPGVQTEDINVQVMNESVTIQGELKDDLREGETYLLHERPTGRFFRMVTLPTQLDSNKTEASFENGILTLRVPKAETARARTIKVNTK